eukprot:3046996-Prymnesium_polylepis.1
MHGRSGAAGRTCFDCRPSIGTLVSLSVSALGGCSFALGVQHVPNGHILRRPRRVSRWAGIKTRPPS